MAQHYISEALDDGWDADEANSICYGEIRAFARQFNVRPAPENSNFDYYCDYRLDSE